MIGLARHPSSFAGASMLIALSALFGAISDGTVGVGAQGPPGVEDQRNTPATGITTGCGTSGLPIFQSFTPRGTDVLAVRVLMRAGGAFPVDGTDMEIALRDGSPTGRLLGSATTMVTGPRSPGAALEPLFSFAAPVAVRPGARVVIEIMSPAPEGVPAATIASVFSTDGDPYPRGEAFGCSGSPIPNRDYSFVTFTTSLEPPEEPPSASPTATPDGPLCWQIADRVPWSVIDAALADPASVAGYDQLQEPGKPEGPYNRRRTRLTLRALALPYHPLGNGLVYRADCP